MNTDTKVLIALTLLEHIPVVTLKVVRQNANYVLSYHSMSKLCARVTVQYSVYTITYKNTVIILIPGDYRRYRYNMSIRVHS